MWRANIYDYDSHKQDNATNEFYRTNFMYIIDPETSTTVHMSTQRCTFLYFILVFKDSCPFHILHNLCIMSFQECIEVCVQDCK